MGFEDPDALAGKLVTAEPTLSKLGRALVLQIVASLGWHIRCGYFSTAFLITEEGEQDRNLFSEGVPQLRSMMKLSTDQIFKLRKAAYGLTNAPRKWYDTVRHDMIADGRQVHPHEPCVFRYADGNGTLCGIAAVHGDDFLTAGNGPSFGQAFERLNARYGWKEWKTDEFIFTGLSISRLSDGTVQCVPSDKVFAIEPIAIGKPRTYQEELTATSTEHTQYRAVAGSMPYLASHSRPDLAAVSSILQGVAS